MRKRRELSPEERKLWSHVARTVAPLAPATPKAPPRHKTADQDLALPPPLPPGTRDAASKPPPRSSPFDGGDPRRERLVARGRLQIDAVLDLHGMRQEEADRATSAFISRSQALSHRVLLIITGKGSKGGSQGRGVLKKRFVDGIEFGLYGGRIASVRPAHQRHGGAGAFYVFLKAPPKQKSTAVAGSAHKRSC